jgi:zinc protease
VNKQMNIQVKKLLIAIVGLLAACSHGPKNYTVEQKPVAYSLRAYETQTLENGLKIIWVRDPKLPIVSMALSVRSGGAIDPKGKEGLADLTAQLLDKGTPGKSAMAIAEQLEQRADSFGASADADATFVGIRGLSFHDEDSLKDFYELVVEPSFPAPEVDRQRQLTLARLNRLVDRPGDFADKIYQKFIFGDHPYFHDGYGTPSGVARISRDDVVKFHAANYTPERSTLAVVGQFDDAFKKAVVKTFSNWKMSKVKLEPLPAPAMIQGMKILEVEKPGLQQTEIRMGYVGVKRNIADHLALKLANSLLGDPAFFNAKLFSEIRIKRGLTYSIRSMFDQRAEPGPFVISTFTRNDKVYEMVDEVVKVLKNFREKGVTQAEVDAAKSGLSGRFPRMVETGDDLAHQLLLLDLYGVSADYLKNFQHDIERVTAKDVNDAIQAHIQPDNLKIVVFGPDLNKGMEELKKFAPTQVQSYKSSL